MLFFIVNPLAQRGQGLRTWKKLEEDGKAFLEKEGFRLFFTKAKGDAKSIAGEIVALWSVSESVLTPWF